MFRANAIKATVLAGLLAQLGRPVVSLLTLPLLLSYLGPDGLGIWMIALSLMGLIGFVSAGLSASIVTAVGHATLDSSGEKIRRIATGAMLLSALYSCIILLLAVPVALFIDWSWLLGLDETLPGTEVGRLMAVLAVLLAAGFFAAVPRQIMVGRMHGYVAHMLDTIGIVAGAVGLVAAVYFDSPLWLIGLAFMGPSILSVFLGGLLYLRHVQIPLFSRKDVDKKVLKALGRDSLRMAGYQAAYAVSSQSDLLLIGIVLGAPASAAFGIAQRVFSLPILVVMTVNNAQWPALVRADAAGKHRLVRRMVQYTLLFASGGATASAVAGALTYEPIIQTWLGRSVETDSGILVGMVAWVLVATLVSTLDSLLRARNETSFLLRSMILMAAINIAMTLFLLPRVGPAGSVWGSVAGFTLALLLPYSIRLWGTIGAQKIASAAGEDAP